MKKPKLKMKFRDTFNNGDSNKDYDRTIIPLSRLLSPCPGQRGINHRYHQTSEKNKTEFRVWS